MLLSTLTDPLYSTELRRAFARLCTISGDLDYKAVRVRAVWTFRVADEILSPAKLEAKWEIRLTVDADRHTIEQRCLVNADFAEWVDYDISYNSSFVIFSECWEPGDKAVSIQDLHRHFDSFLRTSRPVEQRPRFSSIRIEVPIRSDLLGLLLTHVLVQSTSVIRSLHFKYATPLPLFRLKGILRVLLYLEGLYALGEEPQLGRASDFEPWSLLRDLDKLAEFVQDWSYTGKGPLQALTIPIDCTPPDSESVSLPRPTNFSWQGSAGPLETLIFGLFSRSGPVWPRPILDLSRCLATCSTDSAAVDVRYWGLWTYPSSFGSAEKGTALIRECVRLLRSCDVKMQDKLNAATTLREIENWQDLRDLQVAIKRGELDSMME